ncbi:MAG: GNAT family N-acetyltransferase [Candidatus Moraniibacteriota bacterium]
MDIKDATLKDIDAIIKLGNSVNEFQVSDEVVTFWSKDVLIDCINSKNNPILVAKENKQVIGFVIANYNPSFKKAIIENIFIDSNFRGREIGKLLLGALLDKLKELGCKYVCSFTEIDNKVAVKFFLNNDFNKGINCVWIDKILDGSFKK